MHVSYESLPGSSRVYYYPSSRKFYPDEVPELSKRSEALCEELEGIKMSFQLVYDRFLIFFVSESTPLSVELNDRLVEFILSLEKEFEVSLLDKVNVCFKQGEFVQRKEIGEFKKMLKSRSVSARTVVLDPMINNKEEYKTIWEVPLSESWLSHLL